MADKLDLQDNGQAVLVIDDTHYTLRMPRLGQFRELRQLLQDQVDEVNRLDRERVAHQDDPGYTPPTFDLNPGRIQWLQRAFALVGDKELPPEDEWPVWMTADDLIPAIVRHWREVPLARGGR